jgi:light-regulated signal transduction histidine kinase (bacteriophytochrome)
MISSFVKLLEQKYADTLDDTGKEYIHFAVDGADRMQALIQDLLSYSRVGSRDIPLEPVDCDALIQIVLGNLAIAIEEAEASVSVGPLPTVLGDPRQLSQLFQNLISNAIKFKNPERAIGVHISCTSESDRLTFSVTDNGIGIKDEHHERIFAIFQRLHTREEYKGTGIGLSICRKIVDRHGGKIWLESRVGVGTAFHFTLLPAESEKDAHDLHDNFS